VSTALILGARSDIAQAVAHRFAKEGFHLQLAARHADQLADAVEDFRIRHQVEAAAYPFDALSFDTHASFFDALDPKPDVVICVFGLLGDPEAARHDFELARRIIDTNFTGAASILAIVADFFADRGSGTIIGISSVAGDRGRQSNYVYGSAKAGFSAFLAGLRNRLAPKGVHVLTVKPGFVHTAMTEGMNLPGALTAEPGKVANDIYTAYKKKKNVIYTLWMWRYVMCVVRSIPEFIFKKMSM